MVKILFLGIVAATIAALIGLVNQLDRNDLLTRITRTDIGRFTWDFTYGSNLLLFAGIPAFTIISAAISEVREVLFARVGRYCAR